VIPYYKEWLNIGIATINWRGVFTAPVNGIYHFSFVARSNNSAQTVVYFRMNGEKFAISQASVSGYNMAIVTTLKLKKGGTIDTCWFESGAIIQEHLLEEDVA